MVTGNNQKRIFKIVLFLCTVSLFLVLFIGYTYSQSTTGMLETAKENAKNQAEYAAGEIDRDFSELITISEAIANDLSSGELENKNILDRLKTTVEDNPELYGIYTAYTPYAYEAEKRLFAPYYVRENENIRLIQVENVYDYTRPDNENGIRTQWYHESLEKGAIWIEPYFGTAADTSMVSYDVSFYQTNSSTNKKTPAGIIGAEYSLDGVRELVGSLDLGDSGYGLIITEKGTIVSHPVHEYQGKKVSDIENDGILQAMTDNIFPGKHQVIKNKITGQSSWVFYETIPSTKWTLGVVFVEKDILDSVKTYQRHLLTYLTLAIISFLLFLSILIFRADKGDIASLWKVAIIFSVLCILGMFSIWYLALDDPTGRDNNDVVILDNTGMEATLHKFLVNPETGSGIYDDAVKIPTGVFLQSLEFDSANKVIVTGYIWQKLPGNISGEFNPGVIFPEAETMGFEEAYRTDDVIGWYFDAVLRQPFDYSKYPFDREDVWIRMWPADFQLNTILIPDLESYDVIQPSMKPGLEHDFVLEGWDVQNSYFSYRKNSYNTDFGITDYDKQNGFPELYFNVGVKREFMSSFMSDLIALIVVALLLFAVLMISTKHEQRIDLYGFSSSTVLGYCAALFFVLIVSHVSLREKLAASEIIYLEYFYFVMYFAILIVSVNSILLVSDTKNNIFHYEDNLVVKLLYWPVVSGLVMVITLFVFY